MEPETALWGPDLQGPERSPSDTHRGEGHEKGLQARADSGPLQGGAQTLGDTQGREESPGPGF